MLLNYREKELTPVIYGETSVRHHRFSFGADALCFSSHWHERIEILYVREGALNIKISQQTSTVKCGGVAIAAPCELHSATSGKNGVLYDVFMFDISDLKNSTVASEEYISPIISGNINFTNPIYDNKLNSVLDRLLALINEKKAGGRALRIMGKLYEVLGVLYEYSVRQTATVTDKRLDDVLKYINSHFKDNLSTKNLSKKFGYDEAYFCRRFKSVTGLSVIEYIRALRLENACEYIKSGFAISEAAKECGFNDAGYFSRRFKSYFAMTPTEYREKNR